MNTDGLLNDMANIAARMSSEKLLCFGLAILKTSLANTLVSDREQLGRV